MHTSSSVWVTYVFFQAEFSVIQEWSHDSTHSISNTDDSERNYIIYMFITLIDPNNCSSDSMDSNSVTMEVPIPSVSSLTNIPSPPDMKPDITNLSSPVGTSSGYSPSSSHGVGGGPSGFFHMQQNNMPTAMGGPQVSPPGPLQSPTLHSATSMHSPG